MNDDFKSEIIDINESKEQEKQKIIESPEHFVNHRLPDETMEQYKERRKQMKMYLKQKRFFRSEGEDNRKKRREKNKLRFTKPVRKVRKKYMSGKTDVTYAIKHKIPLNYFLRVASMGLDVDKLRSIGNKITEEYNGDNSNRVT